MNLLPLVLVAVGYYALNYNKKNKGSPLVAGEESFTFYYWNKCGHCKKMMPEINRLGSYVGTVRIRKVEASENNEMQVRGYPTMIFRDAEGNEYTYDGARSYSALKEYIRGATKNSLATV